MYTSAITYAANNCSHKILYTYVYINIFVIFNSHGEVDIVHAI